MTASAGLEPASEGGIAGPPQVSRKDAGGLLPSREADRSPQSGREADRSPQSGREADRSPRSGREADKPPRSGREADPRPLRADAARNRTAIVRAARAACDEHGGAADVRDIAQRAGVGMGTLYRHFPCKEDLLAEVLHEQFSAWVARVRTAATAADPWTGLTAFFDQALRGCARQHAVMDCVVAGWSRPSDEIAVLGDIIDELLARARAANLLRPGVTREDLLLMLQSLSFTVKVTPDDKSWTRLVTISLDGLRAHHPTPLP